MKVTYNDIIRASSSMKKLIEKELPVRSAIALSRLIKKIDEEIEIFSTEQKKIVEKYGVINQETGAFTIRKENQKDYADKMTELFAVTVEFEGEKIGIDGLGNIEASVILDTEPFIEFKE